MRCSNCDAEIPEGEKFCPYCGVPVQGMIKCPHCGAAVLPGEQFCGECGREIAAAEPPTVMMPPPTPPPSQEAPPLSAQPPTAPPLQTRAPEVRVPQDQGAKKRSPWLWVGIVVGALALLGCLGACVVLVLIPAMAPTPTPTPLPTATFTPVPTSTPTPLPTATFTPVPTPTPEVSVGPGTLLYEEDFTAPGPEWVIKEVDEARYELQDGGYAIEVFQENWMAWNTLDDEFADFVLEFDVALVGGDPVNAYGCLFRLQDKNNHYELDINGQGSYAMGKDVNDEWTQIIDWTRHPAIRPMGEVNRVRLIAYGNDFYLYVNDQYVDGFNDTSLLSGDIAPVVTAYSSPPARAVFDNLKVWDVELP